MSHPLGTLMQKSRLTGACQTVARRLYVAATAAGWLPHSPFVPIAERFCHDPGWTVADLDCGHNLPGDGTEHATELPLKLCAALIRLS